MKKSERINDMIIFLNGQEQFNLKDIMDRYNISKSTALRDIQSLEEIGMPIFSELGRYGKYGILKNRLLSPIVFTVDEVYALYFSMLTLKTYQSTPFHLSVEKLKKKFESCLSSEQILRVFQMERLLKLETYKHANSSPFLQEILRTALEEKVCELGYAKNGAGESYTIQFFDISASYGQWYATGFNFKNNQVQVFRCDKIISIQELKDHPSKKAEELTSSPADMYKLEGAVDFEVEISEKAVDLFYKEHYPSMTLSVNKEKYAICGFYNKGEEKFISSYFIKYGTAIISIQPSCLKNLVVAELERISGYYKKL
ncbi:helix-turn-helix transcriptional regulator [Paenibacillus sp. IHBB 3054]|uniref:helix-turn-helix transcriptional regulator n=1 Tax=Paenibacillus sp. IHBB 3054 TaxID=3425689 RepID=UPI003F6723A9